MTEPSGSRGGPSGKPEPARTVEDDPSNDIDSLMSVSADEDGYDGFSGILSADSISMSEDVRDYVFENSRRYHKYSEGRYHFPNDDAEQEREDMQHAMVILLCDGKLHFAPLDDPKSILDLGTGTGISSFFCLPPVGDQYPAAEILGVDLSPIQPLWVPQNVQFLVDNVEEEALKPGGWLEIQDLKCRAGCDDGTMREDDVLAGFADTLAQALVKLDIDCIESVENYARWLREAGFMNVKEVKMKAPLGTWPTDPHQKKVGLYNRNMIYDGLHGFTIRPFTHGLGWTPEEVEVYLIDVRKAILNSEAHIYLPYQSVYAQKPLRARSL